MKDAGKPPIPSEPRKEANMSANETRPQAAFDRLLAIAPALHAEGVAPMSDEEVVALVKEVRAERRAARERADRT